MADNVRRIPRRDQADTVALARRFVRAIQDHTGMVGVSVTELTQLSLPLPVCGLEFELSSRKKAILWIGEELLHWLCDRLGGGAKAASVKVSGKPVSTTEMVLIEELGRAVSRSGLKDGETIEFSALGKPLGVDDSIFSNLKVFDLSEAEGVRLGSVGFYTSFDNRATLPSAGFTATSTDASTFNLTDHSGLWDIARGRITRLNVDSLCYWVHQEHPQVGAVILQLAGAKVAAQIFEHAEAHEPLLHEIIYRMTVAEVASPFMAKAVATQAAAYLDSAGPALVSRKEFVIDVLEEVNDDLRSRLLGSLSKRDSRAALSLGETR